MQNRRKLHGYKSFRAMDPIKYIVISRGAQKQTVENLELVGAKLSTIS